IGSGDAKANALRAALYKETPAPKFTTFKEDKPLKPYTDFYDRVKGITPTQRKEIDTFERIKDLSPEDAAIQERAIEKYVLNKEAMLTEYLEKNGNVANADDARK